MTVLSVGMALVRQWLPGVMPPRVNARGSLALEIRGTVTIARAADDRIEASIAARILVARKTNGAPQEPVPAELRVEDRCLSVGALAEARPFLWFQLFDDRGVALSHETFIGRGVGIAHNVHARIHLSTLADVHDHRAPRRHASPARTRLSSGLNARIVARTYRNTSGPRYHVEVLVLTLLAVGSELPAARRATQAVAGTVTTNYLGLCLAQADTPQVTRSMRGAERGPTPTPQASHESPGQPTSVACGQQTAHSDDSADLNRIRIGSNSAPSPGAARSPIRPGSLVHVMLPNVPARMREQSGRLKRQACHEPSTRTCDAPS